jgi:hypothetical protein
MIRKIVQRFDAHSQRMTDFMERMMNVETFGALVFILAFLGFAWAFAWYAHIIGPWVDNLMGWGPHDIDSEGKVRWRRMWSTAICLPGILAYIGLYIRNRRK